MRLERIASDEEFDALREPWALVFDRSADRNPFLTWEWARTWWRHFGARDALEILTVVDGTKVVAIAPFLRAHLGRGVLSMQMLVGIGQENADYGGMLLGERPEEAAALLFGHLEREIARRPLAVNLTRLPPDGDVLPRARARFGADASPAPVVLVEEESATYPYLDFGLMDEPERDLRRLETKNDVRRRRRRLDEQAPVAFEYDAPADTESIAKLFALSEQRWEKKSGRMSGVFAGPRGRAFVEELAHRLDGSRSCSPRLSLLTAGETTVAARFGFETPHSYLGFKECFDPAFASFGPGHMLVYAILQCELERGIREFDFLRGAGDHKSAWANASRTVGYFTLHRRGPSGRAHHALMWNLMRLRARRMTRAA